MAKSVGVTRPSKPKVANQGGMTTPYEQPLRMHTSAPREVASAGRQKFLNRSITGVGTGTSGDGTTARKPKARIS